MSNEACILTTKDLTILEVMLDRCLGREDSMVPLLRRKLNSAKVVFREDVPMNVATLSSRVAFNIDGGKTDTRVISHDHMSSPIGLFIAITSARGLALLGLSEGQEFVVAGRNGVAESIVLEKVLYQPEAVRRDKKALEAGYTPVQQISSPQSTRDPYYGYAEAGIEMQDGSAIELGGGYRDRLGREGKLLC